MEIEIVLVAMAVWLAYLTGVVFTIGKAPILRQYVEKYVASDKVDEKEVAKQMQEMEKQFNKLYGYNKE
jgi:hypothetical protein